MKLDIKGNLACQVAWFLTGNKRLAGQFLSEAEPQVLSLAVRARRILDTLVANKTISHVSKLPPIRATLKRSPHARWNFCFPSRSIVCGNYHCSTSQAEGKMVVGTD